MNFIEKTKISAPKFYEKEFPYLGDFAVEYFLYKQAFEKMHEHLQPFIEHPDEGFDQFIPLYDKIRFYQMDELAIDLAQRLREPIMESNELIDGSELELSDVIIYQIFQESYQTLEQKTDQYNIPKLKDTLKQYDLDETFIERDVPEDYQALSTIAAGHVTFTNDEWAEAVQENSTSAAKSLFWSLAVYMLKRGDFHFSLSASIFSPFIDMLVQEGALLDFNITYKDIDELIAQFFGFLSNKEEKGFAVLWASPTFMIFCTNKNL